MAERKISTKFAIEGESEYKNAVKQINQEMKVLNSEMAKVSSEFSSAQNSMEALSAKAETLAKQYETQSQKVDTMRDALQNAKDAQQEWADKLEDATERVDSLKQQLEELENAEGDTTEEQARLTEELDKATEAQEAAQRGYDAATKGVEDWQTRLNYAEADLNKLNDKIQENDKYLQEAKESTDGCATSIDEYGKATKEAGDKSEEMGSKGLGAITKLIGGSGGGLGALLAVAVKIIGAAKDFAAEMKNAEAIMVRGTGAQGEALRELNEAYKEVMANAKSTSDAVAGSIASLNTRLGLTGDLLAENAAAFEKFGRATGTDAAEGVRVVSDMLYTFNRDSSDIPQILDALTKAAQSSDASVTSLGDAVSESAFYAQEYGMSLEETIAMMAAFEKAGISANVVSRGMKKAYDDVGSSGKTWKQILQELRDGTLTSADAVDLFGAKGANLATVLQNGKVDIEGMTQALRESTGVMEETAEAAETFKDRWKGFWNSVWYGGVSGSQTTGFWSVREEAEETTEALEEELEPSVDAVARRFAYLSQDAGVTSEKIQELTDYLDENGEMLRDEGYAVDETREALARIGAQMALLESETEQATENVGSNLDSLMGRFNEVPATVEISVAQVVNNLNSQLAYMDQYAANMEAAASRGVNDGLLKSLADGSQESAQILAGLVNATDEDIAVLNAKWEKTQQSKETFSRTMGEIQTDFGEKSAALQQEYDAAVDHFNQSSTASANAIQTMYGVIDGAVSMGGKVNATYRKLGENAAIAYNDGFNSVPKAKFAAGTDSAPAGLAWVGEEGPELLMLRGGETIFNHAESVALAREAMAASARAQRRESTDVSVRAATETVIVAVDVKGIEDRIDGVIEAVARKEPIAFDAITGGVDRQLARSKKLIEMSGG